MLIKLLEKHKLTQKQVALSIGKTQQLVSKWCRGLCEPQINEIMMMSDKCNIPIDELLVCFKKTK